MRTRARSAAVTRADINLRLSASPATRKFALRTKDTEFCILLKYKGKTLRHFYQPDLFCFGKIIVELKASAAIADVHRAQLLNYLRITGCRLGLLINFGTYPKVSIERFVL